jgi:hypothetical protein
MIKQVFASLAIVGALALAVPAMRSAPALANGAASTRNILLLGGAAAAYLIIQHNRKVHEKYAEDAARQAALEQENHDAWAAYKQERRAYQEELAVNRELEKEVGYQHGVVEQQRGELTAMDVQGGFAQQQSAGTGVTLVSYGWGQI